MPVVPLNVSRLASVARMGRLDPTPLDQQRPAGPVVAERAWNRMCSLPVDGYMLSDFRVINPWDWQAQVLQQATSIDIRKANLIQDKLYAFPDDQTIVIQAYQTYQRQVKVVPGSILWGIRYTEYDGTWNSVNPVTGLIQVTDTCTGRKLFSEFTFGKGFGMFRSGTPAIVPIVPSLLPSPHFFADPGSMSVEIANSSASDLRCQLVLHLVEPCLAMEQIGDGDGSVAPKGVRRVPLP